MQNSEKTFINKDAVLIAVISTILLFATGSACKVNGREPSIDFGTAKAAYEKFDYVTALKGLRPLADQGNGDAQFMIGKIYEHGGTYEKGGSAIPPDYSQASQWYRVSAEKQNGSAEKALGDLYNEGRGVPKNEVEAARWYRLGSEHGNGAATLALGDKYYYGNGVMKDRCEAVRLEALSAKQGELFGYFNAEGAYNPKEPQPREPGELLKWLRCGANNGVATALVTLGVMYYDGDGVNRNYAEAMRLFTLAAKQEGEWAKSNISVHIAESMLGDMYESGKGVAMDRAQSVKWFRLAADGKYAEAQFEMGKALVNGLGVAQDYSEGARYYHMAAEQGQKSAQAALGAMYFMGKGVPQDYLQAHLWSNLASVDGNEQLLKLRNEVEKKMTSTQVAEAQRLAREWKPKKNE